MCRGRQLAEAHLPECENGLRPMRLSVMGRGWQPHGMLLAESLCEAGVEPDDKCTALLLLICCLQQLQISKRVSEFAVLQAEASCDSCTCFGTSLKGVVK